jgi:hypothetical protein
MECLFNMQIMVAFATEDYGEMTESAYCTFQEIEYCADHQKPVIPIKLYDGAWPPQVRAFYGVLNERSARVLAEPDEQAAEVLDRLDQDAHPITKSAVAV